jgi:hypothetical protein
MRGGLFVLLGLVPGATKAVRQKVPVLHDEPDELRRVRLDEV